jgi:hypothetical protein
MKDRTAFETRRKKAAKYKVMYPDFCLMNVEPYESSSLPFLKTSEVLMKLGDRVCKLASQLYQQLALDQSVALSLYARLGDARHILTYSEHIAKVYEQYKDADGICYL